MAMNPNQIHLEKNNMSHLPGTNAPSDDSDRNLNDSTIESDESDTIGRFIKRCITMFYKK